MTFFDKAREAAERATQSAKQAADQVGQKISDPATQAQARAKAAQAGLQARRTASAARRGMTTLIEKIDPRLLADLIIKSTALQEKTNLALAEKESAYRIGQVEITAAIPPQVSFAIVRIDDVEERITGEGMSSTELVQEAVAEVPEPVLALDGSAGELDRLDDEEPEPEP